MCTHKRIVGHMGLGLADRDTVFNMVIPNEFLLAGVSVNGSHVNDCFCLTCRTQKVDEILHLPVTQNELRETYFRKLVHEEDVQLNMLFKTTMKRIVHGKAYYDLCMRNTHYQYFGWYINNDPMFAHMTEKEKTRFCKKINEVKLVFRDWEQIVTNLTDHRMSNIDARKFSVHQFFQARKLDWCINYNEIHRNPGRNDEDNPTYSEDKYRQILQFIHRTGILADIDHDPVIGSLLGRRLQSDITKMCSLNPRN